MLLNLFKIHIIVTLNMANNTRISYIISQNIGIIRVARNRFKIFGKTKTNKNMLINKLRKAKE